MSGACEAFQPHARELAEVGFDADEAGQYYRVADSPAAREVLQKLEIKRTIQHEPPAGGVDPDKKEQLEAVKRWYSDDWKNLDKKLQLCRRRNFCFRITLRRQSSRQTYVLPTRRAIQSAISLFTPIPLDKEYPASPPASYRAVSRYRTAPFKQILPMP
jgi:hypothetical protein